MADAVSARLLICRNARDHSTDSIGRALAAAGFDVLHVGSAAAVLHEARRRRPAGVVIDLDLADGSGHAACHDLRRLCGDALTIVLISSDRAEARDRVAGLLAGAGDYLAKPVLVEELVLRLQRRLGSVTTVATHIQRILRKLDVHSRAQVIAFAYRAGLLTHQSTNPTHPE